MAVWGLSMVLDPDARTFGVQVPQTRPKRGRPQDLDTCFHSASLSLLAPWTLEQAQSGEVPVSMHVYIYIYTHNIVSLSLS